MIGMAEIIVILIALVLLAIPVGVVIAVVFFLNTRKRPPQLPPGPSSIQNRLIELDALLSRNLISPEEHEEKRKKILAEI
jgi:hypothetical protein